MRLSDVFILEDISILNDILFDNCLKSCGVKFHLDDMTDVLVRMVRFFNANVVWNARELATYRTPVVPMITHVHMPYTKEERLWLENKFELVQVKMNRIIVVNLSKKSFR